MEIKELRKKIELPMVPSEPTKVVPSSLILFGLPKCGKTTICSQLPNSLIIDIERGSDFVKAMKLQPPKGVGPVAIFKWLKEVAKEIKEAGNPYDFVIIDTASYLDELSEWVGTYNYMNSVQGQSFNRVKDSFGKAIKGGKMLSPDDPDYDSVHNIGEGYGYRYSRSAMTELLDSLKDLGKICTIFVCHVKDKFVVSKQTNTEVRTMDLSLTGKVKEIYSRDVDAIGYIWNKGGEVNISFRGNEDKIGGMRGNNHIQGYEGPLDWNKIFKLEKNER